MNRSFLGLIPLLLLGALPFASAACGLGGSESPLFSDGGPNPKGDDAGVDGGCGPIPAIGCEVPCGGGTTTPECVNGGWQCPSYGYGECPIEIDAGDDDSDGGFACPPTMPSGACSDTTHANPHESCFYSGVLFPGSTCAVNCDVWCDTNAFASGPAWLSSCDPDACAQDASVTDSAPPPVDAAPPLFACGDTACDPETSYCEIFSGGALLPDGGTSTTYTCYELPSSCTPGAATCACVEGFQGAGCGCVDSDGKVIETCDVP